MPVRLLVRKDAVGSSTDVPKVTLVIRFRAGLANQPSSDHGSETSVPAPASAANTRTKKRIIRVGRRPASTIVFYQMRRISQLLMVCSARHHHLITKRMLQSSKVTSDGISQASPPEKTRRASRFFTAILWYWLGVAINVILGIVV